MTPLTPSDWSLTFNGESVSLWPSIGSWNLPCQSHYVIKANKVLEAGPWSRKQIEAEVRRDRIAKAKHYGQLSEIVGLQEALPALEQPSNTHTGAEMKPSILKRLIQWLAG
ncbi:DUF6527 family protein [Cupriavidus taiwanensis]|uniref:DUF6527 family protein n=1 Tax=Cupriavidus taiwanensis TaxID=164546 RepID=UPI003F75448E